MANSYSRYRTENKEIRCKTAKTHSQCRHAMPQIVLSTCSHLQWCQVSSRPKWNMCYCSSKVDPSHCCRKIQWASNCTVLYSWCFTLTTARGVSLMCAFQLSLGHKWRKADTDLTHIPSWRMTHSRSLPSMSCGAEQSLKGFSKWWSHAWGWRRTGQSSSGETGWTLSSGMLSAQLTLSFTSRLSSLFRARAVYWQGHWFSD